MVYFIPNGLHPIYTPEADIVQGLVVDGVSFVSVLHQLVHREGGIVRLHNGVRNLQKS